LCILHFWISLHTQKGAEISTIEVFFIMRRNTSENGKQKALGNPKGGAPRGPPIWSCGGAHFLALERRLASSFLQNICPVENPMLILAYFSEAAMMAKVLFFSRRGQILLLRRRRRGEITAVIAINSPLGVGRSFFVIIYNNNTTTIMIPSKIDDTPLAVCVD
jgi:hypothetical protein